MNQVVLLGTAHSIQRNIELTTFKNMLKEECWKYKVKAIAEELNEVDSVASRLAAELNIGYLNAEPNDNECVERDIQIDCRFDLIKKYGEKYRQIKIWPIVPTKDNLPTEVWEEYDKRTTKSYRMRELVWLEKITNFNRWPLLFICGADHFLKFSELLEDSEYQVIKSHQDWAPTNQYKG